MNRWTKDFTAPAPGFTPVPQDPSSNSFAHHPVYTLHTGPQETANDDGSGKDDKRRTFYQRNFGTLRANLRNLAIATAAILAANAGWLAWASQRYGFDDNHEGHGVIEARGPGNCPAARRTSALLHLAINALSSVLLAASAAFVQAYSSPSRDEVDAAHRRGRWLYAGILSWRNLRGVSRRKAAVCVILMASSVPFHLLYNSLVFVSVTTSNYRWMAVTPDFFNGAPFEPAIQAFNSPCESCINQEIQDLTYLRDEAARPGSWQRLEPAACVKAYSNFFQNDRRHVFLVAPEGDRNGNNSLLFDGSHHAQVTERSFFWMCSKDPGDGPSVSCSPETLIRDIERGAGWTVFGQAIDHCLAQPVEGECEVRFHFGIMVAVLVFNAVKLLAMVYIVYRFNAEHLLATVGDAIVSFLGVDDPTSWHMCLSSRYDFKKLGYSALGSRVYTGKQQRWYSGVPKRRWIAFVGFLFFSLAVIAGFLAWGLSILRSRAVQTSLSGLWSLGLGAVDARALVSLNPGASTSGMAILANVPQVFLAVVYLTYNPLVALMFSADWWASLGSAPRRLVVSSPTGEEQKGTPLLGMPMAWGLPLLALHSLLHWLCSQSLFLMHARVLDAAKNVDRVPPLAQSFSGCGYSPIGAVLALMAGLLLFLSSVALGCRKLARLGPPLVGNCTAAISASCHPGRYSFPDGSNGVIGKLQWGAIKGWVWPDGGGHCSVVPVVEDDRPVLALDPVQPGQHYS